MQKFDSSIDSYIIELTNSCKGGKGVPDIITEVPNIFKTLQGLIKDKDISTKNRLLVFACIGYFFIPDDLYPEEELGQIGYIDDILLSLTIFKEIMSSPIGYNALKRNWCLGLEIENVVFERLPNLIMDFKIEYIDVLEYVGIIPENLDPGLDFD